QQDAELGVRVGDAYIHCFRDVCRRDTGDLISADKDHVGGSHPAKGDNSTALKITTRDGNSCPTSSGTCVGGDDGHHWSVDYGNQVRVLRPAVAGDADAVGSFNVIL